MRLEGITWHSLTLDAAQFAATKKLLTQTFGLAPMMEMEGISVFSMPNGTLLELYLPQTVPPYGYNNAIALGFRVDDVEAAFREVAQAGCELLGQITGVPEFGYAYRHFRGPDGRVYGLNEQKAPVAK